MIVVKPSPHGRGVFAARPITIGERILEFTGPLVDFDGAMAKGETHCNVLQITDRTYIDLQEPGVLVNHACDPNCCVRNDRFLAALRNIDAGDELTFDYSTTMGDASWVMECSCGNPKCRGAVGDFETLPGDVQEYYLLRNAVQGYLVGRTLQAATKDRLRKRSQIGGELSYLARTVGNADTITDWMRERALRLSARWVEGL